MKFKLIRIVLLHLTRNGVVPVFSQKLRERVFYLLSSWSFTFTWCMFVTSWTHFCILFLSGAAFGSGP